MLGSSIWLADWSNASDEVERLAKENSSNFKGIPLSISLSVSLSVSLSLSLSFSFLLSQSLSLSFSFLLSLSISIYLSLSLLFSHSLSQSHSLSLLISFCLSLYLTVSLSHSLTLSLYSMLITISKIENQHDISELNLAKYLGVYGAFSIGQAIFVLGYVMAMLYASLNASLQIHRLMFERILRVPMSFFDTTPLGRILNRFSKVSQCLSNSLFFPVSLSYPNLSFQLSHSLFLSHIS